MAHAHRACSKQWVNDEGNLVIDFEVEAYRLDWIGPVQARMYWRAHKNDLRVFEIPDSGQPVSIDSWFVSTASVNGYLKMVPTAGGWGVYGDFEYIVAGEGTDYDRFEGLLVILQYDWVPIIPPTPNFPIPDPAPGPDPAIPIIREEQDLFPYVYLRKWPTIRPYDLLTQFVQYQPETASPPVASLYRQLLSAYPSGRAAMESAALQYIDTSPDFVQTLHGMGAGIAHFPQIHELAGMYPNLTQRELLEIAAQILGMDESNLIDLLISAPHRRHMEQIWQSYFALVVILGYRHELLEDFTRVIVTDHALVNLFVLKRFPTEDQVAKRLMQASILLPVFQPQNASPPGGKLFPLPPYQPAGKAASPIDVYAIGDLQMVRQELIRYEAGDIAYIENVLKGERKEITRRKLNRIAESTGSVDSSEQNTDNESAENQIDLLNETSITLAGMGLKTDYGSVAVSSAFPPVLSGSWTQTWTPDNQNQPGEKVSRFAKDILNRTLGRIQKKISRTRTFSSLNESEETVSSIFDNMGSDNNVMGIYRWLNKVYAARVVNYGNRLVIEFSINNPAASFIRSEEKLRDISWERPVPPEELPAPYTLKNYTDVNPRNYAALLARYGVADMEAPPPPVRSASLTLLNEGQNAVLIPSGYLAKKAFVTAVFPDGYAGTVRGLVGKGAFGFSAGKDSLTRPVVVLGQPDENGKEYPSVEIDLNDEDATVPVVVLGNPTPASPPANPDNAAVVVEVNCKLSPETLDVWKIKTYDAILRGYREQSAAYFHRATLAAVPGEKPNRPVQFRQIERNALKNDCVNALFDRYTQQVGSASSPPVERNDQARFIRFFDQVFDWREMTWLYTGYSPAQPQGNSVAFSNAADSDPESRFAEFLQAGQAQVFVPVRPGYFLIVLYFLRSGMLWQPGQSFCPVNPDDVSLASELKILESAGDNERWESEPWEIRVPTTMVVLDESTDLRIHHASSQ